MSKHNQGQYIRDPEIGLGPTWMPPDGNGDFTPCPALMTEDELIRFLRIPELSRATDHHNVIMQLKRMHGLPRIHLCKKCLYPLALILRWIEEKAKKEGV